MDEIIIYTIIKIEKEDFVKGSIPMVTIYLEDEDGAEEIISMEESCMYMRELDMGSKVVIGLDGDLFPLSMAENLGMFDEHEEISEIDLSSSKGWQAEWMENYMNALEELEDQES